jgi:hypothetical protein
MHDGLAHSGPSAQGMKHGCSLHEIWAGTDYVQNVHRLFCSAVTSAGWPGTWARLFDNLGNLATSLYQLSEIRNGMQVCWGNIPLF